MVKALLSVKPEYAEKILSGEKIHESRRRVFKRKDVDILVIYATRPQCGVVAEARIGGIMESTPAPIGGLEKFRFDERKVRFFRMREDRRRPSKDASAMIGTREHKKGGLGWHGSAESHAIRALAFLLALDILLGLVLFFVAPVEWLERFEGLEFHVSGSER